LYKIDVSSENAIYAKLKVFAVAITKVLIDEKTRQKINTPTLAILT
jgi:hypothetical protein